MADRAFKVGFARTDITPSLGVPMAGYTFLRKASAIRDNLELNALAVSDGMQTAIILAADLLDLQDNELALAMRKRIASAAGVPVETVYFHCTHTHLSPAFGKADPNGETSFDGDPTYCEDLIAKACAAAKAAVADLSSATIAIGHAEAKRISFIRLRRKGKDEIVAVNFGTHPDTVGGDAISADWPGFARRFTEKAMDGVKCIFFNGALGDVNPVVRRLRGQGRGDSVQGNGADDSRCRGRADAAARERAGCLCNADFVRADRQCAPLCRHSGRAVYGNRPPDQR